MCNLVRKWLALGLIDEVNVQRFLEVGCGRGDLLISLGKKGLAGRGIDFSEQAVQLCRERIVAAGLSDQLAVEQCDLFALAEGQLYDLVIAFEVIEHLEDDRAALERIRALLRPRGHFLLSVPAHMRKWGATDVWADHYRRYERAELGQKLRAAGFTVRELLSYGYPLLNLTRAIRNVVYARDTKRGETAQERTLSSGVSLPAAVRLVRPFVPAYSWLVYQTQRPFLSSNLGEGYFVLAQRDDDMTSPAG